MGTGASLPGWVKPLVFILGLLPLVGLAWAGFQDQLGPDPAETLMHKTGEWGARWLILTLLITPLRTWLAWSPLVQLRRMLGLYTFFYACLHLSLFLHFYLEWAPARIWEELAERPFITMGAAAWLILLPLAITSNRASKRRLRRTWKRLHRGIYAVAVLVSLHILWQVRSDFGEALVYIALFAGLLAWRLMHSWKKPASTSNGKLLDAG